ncbi:MAG: GNAT family N-acetyltransferase [Chitinophagaceae bacterium]|nr:GNAT family N-acetyltransferase [Rubrivivax sp.]
MQWAWRRFEDLGVDSLYDALALRCQVFAIEQHCLYLDADGVDRQCWHLLGRSADGGELQAYLRVVDPGVKYAEISIGRVVTSAAARGSGLGRRLMDECMVRLGQTWPGHAVRISAQAHLQRFYAQYGFHAVGSEYLEDNIPHLQMLRPST